MTNPRIAFGEITTTGELARGVHPADELGLQMALALGQPDDPHPPAAQVPVHLDGCLVGWMERIDFAWGGSCYRFRFCDGSRTVTFQTREALLENLDEVLGLASPQPTRP